jgi:hypothetical protein
MQKTHTLAIVPKRPLTKRPDPIAKTKLSRQMAEIEDDNRQLRAAVQIYQEVVRRLSGT